MRHYELVVVLSPMINPDEVTETWERIKNFITTRQADINFEERWGTRRLAYPIRKGQYQFLEGNYYLTRFSTDQPFNRELENFLKVDDRVLRSMVTATLPEDELAAQAAAQARAIRTPPPRPAPVGVVAEEGQGTAVAGAGEDAPTIPGADDVATASAEAPEGTVATESEQAVAESKEEASIVVEGEPAAEAIEETLDSAVEEEPEAEVEEGIPAAAEEPADPSESGENAGEATEVPEKDSEDGNETEEQRGET